MQKDLNAEKQHINLTEITLTGFYGVLVFAIFYMNGAYIQLGGLNLHWSLVLSTILTGTALVHLLVKTDLERGRKVGVHTFVMVLPSLILIFSSIPVWVIEAVDFSLIRRGVIDQLYSITMITAMGGLLYVFGTKAFKLVLTTALASYLAKLLPVIVENGPAAFMNEFITLIVTFADETGPIMEAAELHEPTFSMGMLLVGALLALKRNRKDMLLWAEFALGAFCFLTGFKRISVVAIIGAAIVSFFLVHVTKKGTKRMWMVYVVAFVSLFLCFAYLALTKLGFFHLLEEQGVDTMGRSYLSKEVDRFYTLSPLFLGHGTGFISRFMSDWDSTVKSLHNGPLQIYIDNGFFGFWLWGLAFFPLRTRHYAKRNNGMAAIVALCCTMGMIITSLTDNTIFYAEVAGTLSLVIMYYAMEEEKV